MTKEIIQIPLLPLRGLIIFPSMVLHLDVGRDKSVTALEKAMMGEQTIFLTTQRKVSIDNPEPKDIHEVGTVAKISQMLKLPNGTIRVLVEGLYRAKIVRYIDEDKEFNIEAQEIAEVHGDQTEEEALKRALLEQFDEYIKISKRISEETLTSVIDIDEPGRLADMIASNLSLKLTDK